MAQKRMFDRAIIDTDRFMDLGMTAKAFYFLLGMEADDEGFVSYKKVMRIHGGNEDDMKVLTAKGFILHFPSGVVVITDWNTNNYLDKNRLKPTEYQKEKEMLSLTTNGKYELNNRLTRGVERSGEEKEIAEPISFLLKAELETITEYQDEREGREPKETKTPQNVTALRLRAWCYKKIAEEYGDTPTMNKGDYFQLVKALKKLKEPDIKLMMEDALVAGKGQTVRSVFTDRLIDVYKQENL